MTMALIFPLMVIETLVGRLHQMMVSWAHPVPLPRCCGMFGTVDRIKIKYFCAGKGF